MHIDFIGYGNRPYIIGEESLKLLDRCLEKEVDDGITFVTRTNIDGLFGYGIEQIKDDHMHNKGYIWSSRCGVINKEFDVATIEVCYKKEGSYSYTSCAIDLAHLEPLLADTDYEIVWEPYETSKTDVCYKIQKRG